MAENTETFNQTSASGMQAGDVQGASGMQGQTQTTNTTNANATSFDSFDAWLTAQSEDIKTTVAPLLEKHTAGLKQALKSERDAQTELKKQIANLAKSGQDAEQFKTQLTELTNRMEESSQRAEFYEQAALENANPQSLKLLFQAAKDGYIDGRSGRVNWTALKDAYPMLFTQVQAQAARANAGSGVASGAPRGSQYTMNDYIRSMAGKQ